MAKFTLSSSLVSLVHHVELNKVGWWDKSLQQIICAALASRGTPAMPSDLMTELADKHAVQVDEARFSANLVILQRSGAVVSFPDGRLRLSQAFKDEIERKSEAAQADVSGAKAAFVSVLRDTGSVLDPEETWENFDKNFILPLVRTSGARTYEFISGLRLFDNLPGLSEFLERYDADQREQLRTAALRYFDCVDPSVKRYVLRLVNVGLAINSSSLDEAAIASLRSSLSQPPRLRLFLDTNFLFSILGIHDDAARRCAKSLQSVIQRIEREVPVQMYVISTTVDELTRAINAKIDELRNLRMTPNVARGSSAFLTGPARRFAEDCAEAGRPIDPQEYFSPYISNLLGLLKNSGVELFNQSPDRYKNRQEIIDEIHDQLEYEKQKYGHEAKSYDRMEHDVVLWHFTKERQPPRFDSPLGAEYFVVTEDTRFLSFDAFKARSNGAGRVCLHPTVLLQLLQFWIPRSTEFEEALFGSLGLASIFAADAETEKITVKIIRSLSRFENVGDLPEDTVREALVSDALRQRVEHAATDDEQFKIVREDIIERNAEKQRLLTQANSENQQLKQDLTKANSERVELTSQLLAESRALNEAQAQIAEASIKASSLEQRMAELERRYNDEHTQKEAASVRLRFVGQMLGVTAVLALASVGFALVLRMLGPLDAVDSTLTAIGLALAGEAYIFRRLGTATAAVRCWRVYSITWKVMVSFLGVVVLGIFINLATDWVKYAYALIKR